MTNEDVRQFAVFLHTRVRFLSESARIVVFDVPSEADLASARVHPGCAAALTSPWWAEMVADVLEAPLFCAASDGAEQVLRACCQPIDDYLSRRMAVTEQVSSAIF